MSITTFAVGLCNYLLLGLERSQNHLQRFWKFAWPNSISTQATLTITLAKIWPLSEEYFVVIMLMLRLAADSWSRNQPIMKFCRAKVICFDMCDHKS